MIGNIRDGLDRGPGYNVRLPVSSSYALTYNVATLMLYQVKPWTSSNKSKFDIFDRCLSLCSKKTGALHSPSPSCSPTQNPYPFYFSFAQSINHSLIHTITRSFTQST